MENIFLTNSTESKSEFTKIIDQTANAIADSFCDDKAYSGPTPQELQKIIHQETILPQKGLGWEKTLELTKQKILPNLLRTSSTMLREKLKEF